MATYHTNCIAAWRSPIGTFSSCAGRRWRHTLKALGDPPQYQLPSVLGRRLLDLIDDDHLDRYLAGFELQAKFLNRVKDRGTAGIACRAGQTGRAGRVRDSGN